MLRRFLITLGVTTTLLLSSLSYANKSYLKIFVTNETGKIVKVTLKGQHYWEGSCTAEIGPGLQQICSKELPLGIPLWWGGSDANPWQDGTIDFSTNDIKRGQLRYRLSMQEELHYIERKPVYFQKWYPLEIKWQPGSLIGFTRDISHQFCLVEDPIAGYHDCSVQLEIVLKPSYPGV